MYSVVKKNKNWPRPDFFSFVLHYVQMDKTWIISEPSQKWPTFQN